jgi:hypothetical protein
MFVPISQPTCRNILQININIQGSSSSLVAMAESLKLKNMKLMTVFSWTYIYNAREKASGNVASRCLEKCRRRR